MLTILRCDANAELVQSLLSRLFAADKRFVRPHIAPISVTPAVGDADIIEVSVNLIQRGAALEVKNDICIAQQHCLATQDVVAIAEYSATAEVSDNGFN